MMNKEFKSPFHKKVSLLLLNCLLFPYVLGHFDNYDCACDFVVIKRNCTAFRRPGEKTWQIHDPVKTIDHHVSVISPKHNVNWNSYELETFLKFFNKEQFNHPVRASIIETIKL